MFAKRTAWNSQPNRFSQALERLRQSGKHLLDLSQSNPTDCGLQSDENAILGPLSNRAAIKYEPVAQGLMTARQAVAKYYREQALPLDVSANDIFLTTSTSEAYSYAFRLLCDPGDEVLIPRPGYPLFELLATIQDVKLVSYPLLYDHGWQIDMHALEAAVSSRTRAVVVVNPNNPTGTFVKEHEFQALNELCAAHGLAIISDEVFLDYSFLPGGARSFAGPAGALTFTLSGLSKISGLPQMKVSWMVASGPDHLKDPAKERLEMIADTYLSMNAPSQMATPGWLETRHAFQQQLMRRLQSNLAELDLQLRHQTVCSRLQVEGGWYAVLRVPVTQSDEDLAIKLMEQENVIVHPGHFFDFTTDGFLIVSLMTREDDFSEGVRRVLKLVVDG